jgi:threonine aldolase
MFVPSGTFGNQVSVMVESRGIPVHLDGARLFNAAIALGVEPKELAACAAGLYALKHMADRLADDHKNARYLSGRLEEIPEVRVDRDCLDINMVFFTLSENIIAGDALASGLLKRGIKVNGGPGSYRFVTNRGMNREDIDTVIGAMKDIVTKRLNPLFQRSSPPPPPP